MVKKCFQDPGSEECVEKNLIRSRVEVGQIQTSPVGKNFGFNDDNLLAQKFGLTNKLLRATFLPCPIPEELRHWDPHGAYVGAPGIIC